jgi:alpha-amylase
LRKEADYAFEKYKRDHPEEKREDVPFYMVGEVYFYYVGNDRIYDFGDKKVDYFNYGFDALINFDFKGDAQKSYDELFSKYDAKLHGPLKGKTVLNYISSHDDGEPFDVNRSKTFESATKLMLTQGQSQIYYGDELGRPLNVDATGDAKLRSFMNWDDIKKTEKAKLLAHWQRLGQFRQNHNAVGGGRHQVINRLPYIFSRSHKEDKVVIALDMPSRSKKVPCGGMFLNGDLLRDAYSGKTCTVQNGIATIDSEFNLVLLEKIK